MTTLDAGKKHDRQRSPDKGRGYGIARIGVLKLGRHLALLDAGQRQREAIAEGWSKMENLAGGLVATIVRRRISQAAQLAAWVQGARSSVFSLSFEGAPAASLSA